MKKIITKKLFLSVLFSCFIVGLFAQKSNPWSNIEETSITKKDAQRYIIPSKYQTVSLDLEKIQSLLEKAPMRFSTAAQLEKKVLILPFPDGTFQRFEVVRAPVMHPDLQVKYPNMQSFAGKGVDDPTAYLRFSITHKGFNAMVVSAKHSTVYIDPYFKNDTNHYVCYYKKNFISDQSNSFSCGVETPQDDFIKKIKPQEIDGISNNQSPSFLAGDCQLRTYRLALACTGEYATFHGGTVMDVMAEFVIAMTRVNGVYENDVTVTMELVPNNDDLIYLNGATDPYTNNSGGTMLNENQTTCDNVIGSANYDIGHVFSTGGGGIAQLAVPCTGSKARGVTGLPSPVGDPFYIDYVAHEMGHQFGANHTQNNSCNRNNATAMEPGSASTIMGYAGICAPNVQNNSDDHFHAISIQEITNNIENGNSSGCPVETNTGNAAPTASVASTFYNLPVSTPFALACIGSDPDDDILTYNWEQMDNEVATMPPLSTNTGGPAFRSNSSVESPTRYFPNLNAIINNTTPTWEVIPSVSRDMSFRCTVRDNFAAAGCRDEVDVDLSFHSNAGPFLVMNPNTNLTWFVGASETVIWDVANTDVAPVSCSNVDILLSVDGGFTYNFTLATGVPNTGNYGIIVPNVPTTTARVKVVCSDNIFFDISDQNFEIELPAAPTFIMDVSPVSQSACNTEDLVYNIDLTSILGFDEAVTLTVIGLPGAATATFDNNPVTPPANVQLTIGNLSEVASGTYFLTINAESNTISLSLDIEMTLTDGIPDVTVLSSPADGATGVELSTLLEWTPNASALNYFIEIATSPAFGSSIIESSSVPGNSYQPQNLEELTVYYWRVRGFNICGEGDFSETFAFQTTQSACITYESTDVPVNIPPNDAITVTSTLEVGDDFVLEDVNVSLFVQHTWLGDLIAELSAPSGNNILLFDQPGVPDSNFGCSGDDVLANFDDDAPNSAFDFENTCEPEIPAISGDFQPITPLSDLNGESSSGIWTLTVHDVFPQDGGEISFWSIELCSSVILPSAPNLLTNLELTVPQGTNELITNVYLEANSPSNTADQIIYTLISLPDNGTLFLEIGGLPTAMDLGDQFTQEDINNNLFSYTHDGSDTLSDSFDFDVVNNENGWLHGSTFNINIIENDLSASANLDNDIDCYNANDGQVSITANGGTQPFEYSLDGIIFQSENIFSDLAPGAYTFTVKDANDFIITTNEIIINNPEELLVSADVVDDDITVTASGGTGVLMYSINGIDYQSENVFNDLSNGIYTVYAMDENGCIEQTNVIVAVNTMIVMATLVDDLDCYNDMNATIEVTVGGGTPDYTYSLNGGPFQSSNIFTGLGAGSYTVTVIDNDGFTAETNEIIINNPSELTISADVSGDDITINASGGTGNLTYSIDGVEYQSSNIFNDLANGNYTVYVMDENGCIAETEATILVNNLVVSATLMNDLNCYNENDASIEVAVEGGTPDFTYSLNGGPFQNSNVFSGLEAGTYTVTVMDGNGFTAETNEIIIINPPEMIVSVDVSDNDITINASGGTGGLMYSIDGIDYQSSNIFNDLANGEYIVYVMDANGCITETEVTILVNTMVVTATLTNELDCTDSFNGVIEVQVAGGTPDFTYSLNGGPFQSSNIFSGLGAGNYTVTVMDGNGFISETNEIIINNPPEIMASSSVNGYDIIVNASGGTGTLLYSLSGGPFQISNIFTENLNGNYTITIMDANGCEIMISTIVDVDALSITTTHQNISCHDFNDGTITAEVTGGVSPYQYSIDGINFQDENTFTGLGAGVYTITIIDAGGFTVSSNAIEIINPEVLTLEAVDETNNVTLNVSGGTAPYLYSIDGVSFGPDNLFANLENEEYTFYVQDANGCETTTTIFIDVSGINDLDFDLYLNVYPNPGNGNFIISIKQKTVSDLNFKVFDAIGKLVYFDDLRSSSLEMDKTIDLMHLPGGTYHLVVSNEKQVGVRKLVVLK